MCKGSDILNLMLIWQFLKVSISVNDVPTYQMGYVSQVEQISSFSSDSDCVQTCWIKIDNGKLYEGAMVGPLYCFCTVTQMNLPIEQFNNRKQIHFLLSIFKSEISTCSIGSSINFRVRVSFYLEGNDKSVLYFIDDLNNPLTQSGRMIITNFVDVNRDSYSTRVSHRHNDSKLYNLVEETYSGKSNTKFENFYSLATKVGDMSVTNNHKEWAVMIVSNINSVWISLSPFIISRPTKRCSLVVALSNYLIYNELYVNINMTTSTDCVADLENITVLLHSEQAVKFQSFVWDDFSVNSTSSINDKDFNLIYVRKLFVDSFLKFSAVFEIDVALLAVGITDIAVKADIFSTHFSDDNPEQIYRRAIFRRSTEQLPRKETTQTYPTWSMKNETNFENVSHQCICKPVKKRQQSMCYQQEKLTGRVIFFPIQMVDVIGYDSSTNLLYGKTFRDNIVEVNLLSRIPIVIISEVKWQYVKSSSSFQTNGY